MKPAPHPRLGDGRRSAFTLIELLVVILVLSVLGGMALALPLGREKEGHVKNAAEELAAVLRETRTRAIKNNRPYAVAFHIENAPGSSGKILNNRSGGHWYRVLGPNDILINWNGIGGEANRNALPLMDPGVSPLNGVGTGSNPVPLRHYLERVSRHWTDEAHHLLKGKVRFLALTDQDNGDNAAPAQGGFYSATYPRPWFGWWDAGTKQLHSWGGYDPTLQPANQYMSRTQANGRICSHSGFYYEGYEGEITGCTNPADRRVLDDDEFTTSPGTLDATDVANGKLFTVLKQGEARPLINANWLDFILIFRPDGSVTDDWFRARQAYWWQSSRLPRPQKGGTDPYPITFPRHDLTDAGIGDMCNGLALLRNWDDPTTPYLHRSTLQREATSFVQRTGYHWITLAADAKDDRSTFATAEDALRSLNPIYRVGVSPDGQVKVIRVRTTYNGPLIFDATFTGADWQDRNKVWGKAGGTWNEFAPVTTPNYINNQLNNADGSPRGLPVFDHVLPEMLSERKWWWAYP